MSLRETLTRRDLLADAAWERADHEAGDAQRWVVVVGMIIACCLGSGGQRMVHT
ncbi:hypothetical protein [Nocardioides bruguierae]|uniref:Uncharacterized protein n=1 Tax=Nocardioides bruguierae TaxID=2945102 RepID=A0A9X2D529_9ACTN|nr:hypothetical protein [Nocardioides bruguierae]MCM0619144.1 hypothetical protein [Nocardioides bruguierae]